LGIVVAVPASTARGCGLGVDRVGLAMVGAQTSVEPRYLHHAHPLALQVAGETGAVRSRPLDADGNDFAVGPQPQVEPVVAGLGGGELAATDQAARGVDGGGTMHSGVRVDPADDLDSHSMSPRMQRRRWRRAADKPVMRRLSSSSYQVTLVAEPSGFINRKR
jgi:hypothetical protein